MQNFTKLKVGKFIFCFISIILMAGFAYSADSAVKIGVLAKRGAERCLEKWSPTAEYLTVNIPGKTFVIVPIDHDRIYTVVENGEVDFILTNPSFYVELESWYKVNRIATLKNKVLGEIYTTFGSVVFCKKQREDIRHLIDLKGKTFMAVKQTSFGGWRMAWRELKEAGIDPFKNFAFLSFGGIHDAVIYAVRDGKVDAGTVRTDALERMNAEGKIRLDDFYVIHEHGGGNVHLPFPHSTREYPEWPIAKLKHTSNEVAENVAVALIGMPQDSAAAQTARCAGWTIPLNYQPVHDCLKELKVGPYKDLGKITLTDVFRKYWILILINFATLVLLVWFLATHIMLNRKIKTAYKELKLEVNERIQAEEALRESEGKHRLLAENTVDCIWQMNLDLKFTYINQAIFPFLGYTTKEWIGSKLSEHCSLEEMEKMQAIIADLLANLPDKTIEAFETSLYHENGEEIPCEINGKIVLDDAGNPIYFQGTTRNITERKRAEMVLKESNDRQRYLYSMTRLMCDNLPDLIWTKDLENRFIFANKACCEILLNAKDTDEPIGKTGMYFAAREKESHPENPGHHTFGETCIGSDVVVLKTKKPQRFEEVGNLKGKFVCLDVYKAPFWDEKGKLIGTVGCAKDITRRKEIEKEKLKLESQLKQAQKMESLGTLAGGIAHDFNNILFPVSGYTEMLLQDVSEDDPFKQSLIKILQGTKRAGELVSQILTFSRQKEHELKPLKVEIVVKEALKLIRSSLPTTIEIRQNVNKNCGLVMADPTQIHQIVMNLITNAYHAMGETGGNLNVTLKEVELGAGELIDSTMEPGSYVCLTVADTGIGMDQSVIDRMFDPYFTTKEEGKGTGLGLSVAHGIVKSHSGYISVYSEPGKGTEIKVYLPLIQTQAETAEEKTPLPIEKGNESVLLVDDREEIVSLANEMLCKLGYNVTARTSSIEALEAFRANPNNFDLVITDLTMPNMTGDKLAKQLIAIRPDIPVILCTGFSEKMSKEKAEALGIKGFLMKPIVMSDLAKTIREVLEKKQ